MLYVHMHTHINVWAGTQVFSLHILYKHIETCDFLQFLDINGFIILY